MSDPTQVEGHSLDAQERLFSELFDLYVAMPEQLPNTTRSRVTAGEDPYRVVCDYVAGMTDRYCLTEYQRLFAPYPQA